jgi:pyruvate/2-oxoglutarate dehydrogenase complex dihydrolipoamide acyltransferase (E2) component
MSSELRMPQLGMMMMEGTLLHWLVPDGARVKAGQDIAEIESEKAVQAIPAPEDGVLRQLVAEGQVVPVLSLIGTVE